MEVIVGIIVVIVLWSFFKSDSGNDIKKAIGEAYLNEGEIFQTSIPWIHAKRFAKKRGEEIRVWDDGGESLSVEMLVNGEEVTATLTLNQANRTTFISADNSERLRKERQKLYE
ncbi:hypothetical protein [Sulfurimonas sp. NW15]|uniref:hypothetical protein n=1 Tax=unclassified Sulfurimonas TaxID=2623549 RepID=UPI003DA8A777